MDLCVIVGIWLAGPRLHSGRHRGNRQSAPRSLSGVSTAAARRPMAFRSQDERCFGFAMIVAMNNATTERSPTREWEERGIRPLWARALVANGILTLDHLRDATDHQLSVLPAAGRRGLRQVCALVGRKPPGNAKMP